MNQHLALTVLTENQPDTLSLLTQFLGTHQAVIESCKLLILGSEFAMLILIKAPWNEIAKLETQLPIFANQHNFLVQFKRTEPPEIELLQWISYSAEFIAREPSNLLENVSQFFFDAGAQIYEISDNHYQANFAGMPMYSLALRVLIPADTLLSDLRERLVTLADFLNIDAYFEPERN